MITLGPLSFAAPLALLGLLTLPVLWLLLRATPPAPKQALFPPLRLLLNVKDDAETPHSAPWWLILFRLLMAALIIIALARPSWGPQAEPSPADDAPLLLVIDNGWSAAENWSETRRLAGQWLDQARRDGRLAALILTAAHPDRQAPLRLDQPVNLDRRLQLARPQAWPSAYDLAETRIREARAQAFLPARMDVIWLSDGLDQTGQDGFARELSDLGPVRLWQPEDGRVPLAILPPEATPQGLDVRLQRIARPLPRDVSVTALGADGQAIARADTRFAADSGEVRLSIDLPLDLRNRITRLQIDGSNSAGAVHLLGDQWQRPRTGLIEPEGEDGQPLLSELHYIESALAPHTELVTGDLASLIDNDAAILVMVDSARSDDDTLSEFVEDGGVLLRFAGPRLAARSDDLLPVVLREGGRLFGGALNWDTPQRMAPFDDRSPFAGLPVDVSATIDRQVLAEPGTAAPDRIWARLEDGTPLVTAERRGNGWIILFHVTASPDWSDLPLSGLFPRMLQRITGLARTSDITPATSGAWVLDQILDGNGQLSRPGVSALPIPDEQWSARDATALTPPGLYRLGASLNTLNIATARTQLTAMSADLQGVRYMNGMIRQQIDLLPALLIGAFIALMADILLALALAGRLPRLPRRAGNGLTALLLAMGLSGLMIDPASAQPIEGSRPQSVEAALSLRFAYVETGDASVDQRSREGLTGLGFDVRSRSAMEPAPPHAVDPAVDELIFYPMIYWPVLETAQALDTQSAERVSAYLQSGGLIIFDTQDADRAFTRAGAPHPGLVSVLESIDVPTLSRIPNDHVLTKAFYLLQEFPGRYSGSPIWVEANPDGASRDGTSGVVIGAHDWAAAWAVGPNGEPLYPVDGGDRQREMARRVGVNMAMYALTGNYKADQVHVPALLERLGQ
ncbi:DUF4159 domain-containing protein [Maricaulis sp. D1M11]|uniref:DUF4159 domain-containing protein n=1 Tax=Maricaulis sp. D1M11 TaxID=3076117 RepID=UPI0039B52BD9